MHAEASHPAHSSHSPRHTRMHTCRHMSSQDPRMYGMRVHTCTCILQLSHRDIQQEKHKRQGEAGRVRSRAPLQAGGREAHARSDKPSADTCARLSRLCRSHKSLLGVERGVQSMELLGLWSRSCEGSVGRGQSEEEEEDAIIARHCCCCCP